MFPSCCSFVQYHALSFDFGSGTVLTAKHKKTNERLVPWLWENYSHMIMKLLIIELVSQGPRAVGLYTNCVLQNNVKKKRTFLIKLIILLAVCCGNIMVKQSVEKGMIDWLNQLFGLYSVTNIFSICSGSWNTVLVNICWMYYWITFSCVVSSRDII